MIAGDFPTRDGYVIQSGAMGYMFKTWKLNQKTVKSVEPLGAEKNTDWGMVGSRRAGG